jgi:hypothetical protein
MTRVTWTTAHALGEFLSPGLLLSFALILHQPAVAQTTAPPLLIPTQQLMPTDAEIYPTPGSAPTHVGFGGAIALQRDTALISMPGYQPNAGRVALFKQDASGQWERDGSIDPASTPGVYAYGFGDGIALRDDYALIMSTTANYLYRKVLDRWTQLDLAKRSFTARRSSARMVRIRTFRPERWMSLSSARTPVTRPMTPLPAALPNRHV